MAKIICLFICVVNLLSADWSEHWIKDEYYWWCERGNFYAVFVKPFEDIIGMMGLVCDPNWD